MYDNFSLYILHLWFYIYSFFSDILIKFLYLPYCFISYTFFIYLFFFLCNHIVKFLRYETSLTGICSTVNDTLCHIFMWFLYFVVYVTGMNIWMEISGKDYTFPGTRHSVLDSSINSELEANLRVRETYSIFSIIIKHHQHQYVTS